MMFKDEPIVLRSAIDMLNICIMCNGADPERIEMLLAGDQEPITSGQLELGDGDCAIIVLSPNDCSPENVFTFQRVHEWGAEHVRSGRLTTNALLCWRMEDSNDIYPIDAISNGTKSTPQLNVLRMF